MSSVAFAAPPTVRVESVPRLFNRNVLLLWQAQVVSQFGNQAFTIAMMFWTAATTQSATLTGLVLMAGMLPGVVLGPLTGSFADRQRSRLRIIMTCDLASGALVSLLAVGFLAGPRAWHPALLFVVALFLGVSNAFFTPAVDAFAPDLVSREQIEALNAFQQSSRHVTVLSAQALGGMLYALVGPAALFLLDGLSFLFAAASEMLIRPPQYQAAQRSHDPRPPRPPQAFVGHAADGFRYVAAQRGMLGFLIAFSVFNALLVPMAILLPVYTTAYLRADVRWYGFLLAAISAGAIAGCTLAGGTRLRSSGRSPRPLLLPAFVALGFALAVLGQIRSRWIALAIAFTTGVLTGVINVLVLSILQRRTSSEFRGRVIGVHATISGVLVPIGLVGGGAIADLTGRNVPVVYAICGGLALTSVLLLAGRRSTRTFLAAS